MMGMSAALLQRAGLAVLIIAALLLPFGLSDYHLFQMSMVLLKMRSRHWT